MRAASFFPWTGLVLLLSAAFAGAAAAPVSDLPEQIEVPEPRPDNEDAPAADPPLPLPRPADEEGREAGAAAPTGSRLPPAEHACLKRLERLGVAFETRPGESDPSGCALPHPVAVTALSPTVTLEPEALMACALAETAARFVQEVAAPEAQKRFGSPLASVRQDSAYVCRPRRSGSKLSEHAFGRAVDLGAFRLGDGRVIEVGRTGDPVAAGFLTVLRKAACGPFKTVLGPGSDTDHAAHFHLDLAPRRGGSAYCR